MFSELSVRDRTAALAALHSALIHLQGNVIIGSFVRHGLFDRADDCPFNAHELAARVGLHPLSTERGLRLLASFGIFREIAPRIFADTNASRLLCRGQGCLRNFAWWITSDAVWQALGGIDYSFRTGHASFSHIIGTSFWEYLRSNPEDAAAFDASFAEVRGEAHEAIARGYDWSGVRSLIDVGGGNGSLLATILTANSDMEGALLERPEVLPATNKYLEARGVRARVTLTPGSIFEPINAAAECWILSQILHDWGDDECKSILNRCRSQMRCGDRLLVVEMLTIPGKANIITSTNDIMMLALFGEARQRSADEYISLFASSGLVLTQILPTKSPFSIVEARLQVPA